ncbi:MAG: hypothetical protein B6D64_03980 [Bacteroidetes bacterium 4484_276]|nr:MAG: hypothetical protein B6D64_03980 [Bacteroidetes bacterium 4484_276]
MKPGRRKLNILIFCLLIISSSAKFVFAQQYDSTFYPADSNAIFYFHNNLDICNPLELTSIDTTLYDFEEYGPLSKSVLFNASLGNVGLAYKDLDFKLTRKTGFDYGINTFDAYLFDDSEIKYFVNPRPYTEVAYITGANKEQLFSVRHDQRVFKRLTLGLDFELINSLGSYQRQKSNDTRVVGKIQYFTENLRYGIIANYSNSRVAVRENGGILYDSIYEQNLEPTRSIVPVKLTDAENQLRKSGVYLQQYFQLSKKGKSIDADSSYRKKKINLKFGRIAHSFNFKRNSQLYTDLKPDVNYYPAVYSDSTETHDSVFFQNIENTFSWSNSDYMNRLNPQPFVILFGIKHEIAKVHWYESRPAIAPASPYKDGIGSGGASGDPDLTGTKNVLFKSTFSHLIAYGKIEIIPHPALKIKGGGSYILNGDEYQGDFDLNGLATLEVLRKKPFMTTINLGFDFDNHAAPYFFQYYFSNHFWWDNGFNKVKTRKISAFITQRDLRAGVELYKIHDYIYIGLDTLPAQFNQSVEIVKAYLHKKFRIGKFDIDGRFIYQQVSEKDIIRVPEFITYFTATFNLPMFNGALKTRSGFDVYYTTKYFADAYMPAIRSFYLQNNKEIGNFFHVDFFLNFNVKRTRFFMKLQNLLSAFGESNFYAVPHYPLQDLSFKFGLSWRFHD